MPRERPSISRTGHWLARGSRPAGGGARTGVDVTFLVPGQPHPDMTAARRSPRPRHSSSRSLRSAGMTTSSWPVSREQGRQVTTTSTCTPKSLSSMTPGRRSAPRTLRTAGFHRDTELNASFWHPATVRALRVELLQEHLGLDTSHLDARSDGPRIGRRPPPTGSAKQAGEPLHGLAHALDPAAYGA
jgi:hypothetical protein